MQRLSGLDASFLYLETPTAYMHVAGLMVLDPVAAPVAWSFDEVRNMYAARLHLAPPFRRRLVNVPLGLHHPLWIEDPDFDLDFHLRHIAVPRPGGPQQLAALAEEIVARPLDRRKPLWEAWVIEGLEHGYVAVLTKTHHAAIDGVSGNELTLAMLDTEPEGRDVGTDTWQPERVPNDLEVMSHALSSLARQPAKLAGSLSRTGSTVLNLTRQNRQSDIAPPPAPFSRAPHLVEPRDLPSSLVCDDHVVARRCEGREERVRHDAQRRRDGDVRGVGPFLSRSPR